MEDTPKAAAPDAPVTSLLLGAAEFAEFVAKRGAVVLPERSPAGEMLVAAAPNVALHKMPGPDPVLPARVAVAETVIEPLSFVEYVNRFKTASSVAFAYSGGDKFHIDARLDYHDASAAGAPPTPQQNRHVLKFDARLDPDWTRWAEVFGEYMGQEKFALFLDDMAHTIGVPPLADLLETVRTVDIERSIKLKSRKNDQSGAVMLTYEENDSNGTALGTGQLTIPSNIGLVLPVFLGTPAVSILAKLRFQLERGHIMFAVSVPAIEKLVRDEFDKIAADVEVRTQIPLYFAG